MPAPGRAPVLVAAGGTGGHLFPAEALAAALAQARHRRSSRHRPARGALWRRFPGRSRPRRSPARHCARATRSPLTRTAAMLGVGLVQAWALIGRLKPAAVIGFGGYPTMPPVLAAAWRGIPTLIHDANAVIGRANRLLAPRVTAIATTFPDVFRAEPRLAAKATLTGNPVRPAVVAAAATPYPAAGDPLRLLGFRRQPGRADHGRHRAGRDRAARPGVCARGSPIVQQAREEDLGRVRDAYAESRRRRRSRAILSRSAGAHGGEPSGRGALGRLDRRRACGDRPAGDPGAAAARARSGPVRQCRRAGRRRRRDSAGAGGVYAASGSPPRLPRSRRRRSGSPPWRRRRGLWAGSTPPTGSPTWCSKVAARGANQ